MKLLLKIQYDGTAYAGYQTQPDRPSIQKTLTETVSAVFGFPCTVTGCSRTDAGVHALGFCCAVAPREEQPDNWLHIPIGKIHRILNRALPADISVCGEAQAADDFHPRYSVREKTYFYKAYDTIAPDPFRRSRAWHLKRPLPQNGVEKMNAAAQYLLGRHDYTSFMAAGSKITDAVRSITSLSVRRSEENILLSVTADGFLYHMVRIIMGTLTDCAFGTYEPEDMEKILQARNRMYAGRTAPSDGLYLAEVQYDREINWKLD